MFIVFCHEISSMGKKFEDNSVGIKDMGEYVCDCLKKFPHAKVRVERYL